MEKLADLNPQQREAVLHEGTPLLILAGAGSGKTRVITTKIAYLVSQKNMDPLSILAVTFTNKAANEMKNRILSMAPEAEKVMIRTFHSFGAWLLRRHSHLLGLESYFTISDEDDSFSLLKRIAEKRFDKSMLRNYLRSIGRAKDYCLSPNDDLSRISLDRTLKEIYRLYQEELEASGKLDFGDLIMQAVELLRRFPEVKQRIQQRFRVILVDEYQDANTAQFLLLKELYRRDNYLCVVGDEDQSIYRFRGADVQNILQFSKAFPDTKIIRLEQNYRSTQTILEAATQVVEHNEERLGKKLWSAKGPGVPIGFAFANDEREEAYLCAGILDDGQYENTAILYRNNYQSRTFETLFSRLHIPFRLIGSLRFAEREEVKDALAYLSFILNVRDKIAFTRIINKPSRGIGKTSLEKILGAEERNCLDACRQVLPLLKGKAVRGTEAFIALIEDLSVRMNSSPTAELIRDLLHDSGLYQHYSEKDEADETNRIQNLEELVSAGSGYYAGAEGLAAFLESLQLNGSDENPYEGKGAVNLITMHNTKGLEFERVIITGLEDGLLPHYRDDISYTDLELEEERRLFYVAMTRAKEKLFLISCRQRQIFGMTQNRRQSRFLEEIPSHLQSSITASLTPGAGVSWGAPEEEEEAGFYKGCRIYHADYGEGVIAEKWHNGRRSMVTARFSSGRTAKFILKYANLERISPDD